MQCDWSGFEVKVTIQRILYRRAVVQNSCVPLIVLLLIFLLLFCLLLFCQWTQCACLLLPPPSSLLGLIRPKQGGGLGPSRPIGSQDLDFLTNRNEGVDIKTDRKSGLTSIDVKDTFFIIFHFELVFNMYIHHIWVWLIWSSTVSYPKLTFQERYHISYMKDSLFWKIEKVKMLPGAVWKIICIFFLSSCIYAWEMGVAYQ